jgi:hypothetical protein
MAVQDKYVDTKLVAGRTAGSMTSQGSRIIAMVATFEIAVADSNESVYRLFPSVPSNLIPKSMRVACDAAVDATDCDFGLYKPGIGGAVVEIDILGDGLNLTAGYSRILALDALVSVDIADAKKCLWELVGSTINSRLAAYDICMTARVAGGAAGTVTVWAEFYNP